MGKTVLAKSLAKSVEAKFSRIQFTPDLLPSDVTGLNYFNQKENEFIFSPGPAFCNILLADEINRATPRTQSSLLECMGERQITVDGKTMRLEAPFFVIATQNPIETLGTYPLPEAQLDRVSDAHLDGRAGQGAGKAILLRFMKDEPLETLGGVCTGADILELQRLCARNLRTPCIARLHRRARTGDAQWPECGDGRQPARQPRAAPRRACFLRSCAAAPMSCRRTSRPSPSRARAPYPAQRLRRLVAAQQQAVADVLASVPLPTEDWSK